MQKKLFQFFQGQMKPATAAAINDLKTKAERAGYQHELYNLNSLLAEIKDENTVEAIRRMWKYLPFTMAASATSDYFRYWCLKNGGIYCDDDVYCTVDEFPKLPENNGVFTCSEQTHRHLLNTCVTIANGPQGALYSRIMEHIGSEILKHTWLCSYDDCKKNAEILKSKPWSLIGYLGPGLVRNYMPLLIQNGVIVERMPYELCSSHDYTSKLFHLGSGTWCFGGKGNPNAQKLK